MIIVKSTYSPIKGTADDADGTMAVITSINTVNVRRTLVHNVILITRDMSHQKVVSLPSHWNRKVNKTPNQLWKSVASRE